MEENQGALGNGPVGENEAPAEETVTEETEETTETAEVDETDGEPSEEPAQPEEKTVPLKVVQEERRKRQELERRLAEVEQRQVETPKAAPKTIEEFYEVDPDGVMTFLTNEIKKLAAEDPYENAVKIEELRDKKAELREYGKTKQAEKRNQFFTDLEKAVPGFSGKKNAITEFAVKELGYDAAELAMITNPANVGHSAALKTVKMINRQFEAAKASETFKTKEKQPKPTTVEAPGEGMPTKAPDAKLQKLYDKARKGQIPWATYIEAAGI